MYTKSVPHKNFLGKPRTQTVNFNLTTHEFFKLLVEFKAIFDWQERLRDADPDEVTDTAEVIAYYTNFEEILLAAYGVPDESGDHFHKAGRYDFAESTPTRSRSSPTRKRLRRFVQSSSDFVLERQSAPLRSRLRRARTRTSFT
jgi:hypothetical protein